MSEFLAALEVEKQSDQERFWKGNLAQKEGLYFTLKLRAEGDAVKEMDCGCWVPGCWDAMRVSTQ